MAKLTAKLKNCDLFQNISEEEIKSILSSITYRTKSFSKNQVLAFEEDHITEIGIILHGQIEMQKIFSSSKTISITKMKSGDVFGEVIVFSNTKQYPVTIISTTHSIILFISKNDILKTCKLSTPFLENLIGLLSQKTLLLSNKLTLLSYKTIREKIANYLLSEFKKENSLTIKLHTTKKKLSEHLGITRPSFSRELINMKEEGLIKYGKATITIINLQLIKDILS